MARSLALAAVAIVALGAATAGADTPGGGGWLSGLADGPPISGLVPSAWVDDGGLGFTVRGSLAIELASIGPAAARSPLVVEVGASAAGRAFDARDQGALSLRAHAIGPSHGFWLGGSVLKRDIMTDDAYPVLSAGSWASHGRFLFGVQTLQFLNRMKTRNTVVLVVPDSVRGGVVNEAGRGVPRDDARLLTGAEASANWSSGRLEVESRLGALVSLKGRPGQWVELRAAYQRYANLAVFARMRSANGVPDALESVRGNQTAVGVQLTPSRPRPREPRRVADEPAIDVLPLGGGRYAFVLATRCRRVELCADATGWAPVAATRGADGSWRVELDLDPGVHRVAFRIDGGAWRPPPGLPTAHGEFGDVGLVVIE